MVWVKICGITNSFDAKMAVALGVNALGFIFAPSKRQVDPVKVKEIVDLLPAKIEKIGVFLNQEREFIWETIEYCGLTGVQFHGSESPQYCRQFKEITVIKAFSVDRQRGWKDIPRYIQAESLDRVLLDTYVKGLPGGTGQTFPWELVKNKNQWGSYPVIIAGGINPDNVTKAIEKGNPFGIDVASGVELNPGKKDREKIKELMAKLRG